MPLVVLAIALATGKTSSLFDLSAQLGMELYTYLCWPVVSGEKNKQTSMNGESSSFTERQ